MARISYDLSDYNNGDGTMGEGDIFQPAIDQYLASIPANATDEMFTKVISKWEDMIERRLTTTIDMDGARVKLSGATLRALVDALRTRQSAGA